MASSLLIIQVPGLGSLERRILEVNRKRIKVVKPGSKTSFPTTEIRGTYAPPFHVSLFLEFNMVSKSHFIRCEVFILFSQF